MVKIILLCSSSQANALLDNVAPTYQAVNTKTTSKHRVWGLARLVLRILEPQEICILLRDTTQWFEYSSTTKSSFCRGKKVWKIFSGLYIRGGGGSLLKLFGLIRKRTFTSIIPNWNWFTAKWNYQTSPHTILTHKDKHLQLCTVTVL